MSDLATGAIAVTVRGSEGSVDLAVPPWTSVEALAAEYAAAAGVVAGPRLVSTTGRPLEPGRTLVDLRVRPGDVLVAVEGAPAPSEQSPQVADAAGPASGPGSVRARAALVIAAGLLAVGAALVGALAVPSGAREVAGLLLVLAGLTAAASAGRAPAALGLARAAVAPVPAAAGAFLLTWSTAPGRGLLAVVASAATAGVVAAMLRAGAAPRTERLLRVWLTAAAVVATSAVVVLVTGVEHRALWAWLLLLAVVSARLLPHQVVDVPDETLLDLDRLAVTAWSARERPSGGRRRRLVIRPDGVSALVRAGRDLLVGGTVAGAVLVAASVPLLLADPGRGAVALGVHLLVLFGGAALLLTARSYRASVPRTALRLSGTLAVVAVAAAQLLTLGGAWLWWVLAAGGVAAAVVVVAAVAVGGGWRSVWWARTADVVEGLAVVVAVAALPLAAGLFDAVRQLAS